MAWTKPRETTAAILNIKLRRLPNSNCTHMSRYMDLHNKQVILSFKPMSCSPPRLLLCLARDYLHPHKPHVQQLHMAMGKANAHSNSRLSSCLWACPTINSGSKQPTKNPTSINSPCKSKLSLWTLVCLGAPSTLTSKQHLY